MLHLVDRALPCRAPYDRCEKRVGVSRMFAGNVVMSPAFPVLAVQSLKTLRPFIDYLTRSSLSAVATDGSPSTGRTRSQVLVQSHPEDGTKTILANGMRKMPPGVQEVLQCTGGMG